MSDDKRGSSKKVDPYFSRSNATVYEDEDFIYDCMLNQTNIANNNNKFYKIQLVQVGSIYHVLIRYGRGMNYIYVSISIFFSNQYPI